MLHATLLRGAPPEIGTTSDAALRVISSTVSSAGRNDGPKRTHSG